jgi:hypothetical protein
MEKILNREESRRQNLQIDKTIEREKNHPPANGLSLIINMTKPIIYKHFMQLICGKKLTIYDQDVFEHISMQEMLDI